MNSTRPPNQFALSIFWFAWEVHWAALLGAAMQVQVARFIAPGAIGTATAVLSGAGALFSIASQFGSGLISDRLRVRIPFLVAGTLLDVAALFGFASAPSFSTVVAAFVAVQISLNVACGPYQALIPERIPRSKHGAASGVMALYRLLGNAVGLLFAKAVIVQPGPGVPDASVSHGLFLLVSALSIVLVGSLAVTVLGVRDVPSAREPSARQTAAWPNRSSFAWLVVSRTLVSMGLYLLVPFFLFFLEFALNVKNYVQTNLSLLLLINICALAGTLPAGMLGDRLPKKTIMFAALCLLAAGAFALATTRSTAALQPLAVALGIGWGAYYSVDWALACNLLPERRAGALMAIWNIGASGPQVLSPLIGGIVVDRVNAGAGDFAAGYRLLFLFIAVYVALGASALAFVREPQSKNTGRESGAARVTPSA